MSIAYWWLNLQFTARLTGASRLTCSASFSMLSWLWCGHLVVDVFCGARMSTRDYSITPTPQTGGVEDLSSSRGNSLANLLVLSDLVGIWRVSRFVMIISVNTIIVFIILKKKMPQLVPFYFINEVSFTFLTIAIIVYISSKYILPRFVRLFLSRTFISKLLDNGSNS